MDDIQDLFKETIAEFMENGLEAELDECPLPSIRDRKSKEKWNNSCRIGYLWLGNGVAQLSLKTRGREPTQSGVRAEGVVESSQIGKHIVLRRSAGRILL